MVASTLWQPTLFSACAYDIYLPVGASLAPVADDSQEQLVVCRPQQSVVVAVWGPCHAAVRIEKCLHCLRLE